MTFILTKTFPRLWSLEAGVAMIVTDLHGDWDAYQRYRDRFVDLQANGRVDCLILTGDLIHSENPTEPDNSLGIVLDVIAMRAKYGQAIIFLLGNHEMPHIYGTSLAKGQKIYTPAFEAALSESQCRTEVIALFDSLPFYLRTRAGVSVTHAGASAPLADPERVLDVFNWSHQSLLDWANEILATESLENLRNAYTRLHQLPYDILAKHYLAISGPDDPRYNDLLRGFIASKHPTYEELLWPILFIRCEEDYGQVDYASILADVLQALSVDFFPQRALVAGHMTVRHGHQIVARRHLRLASAHHATPREQGQYLLFDTAQPIRRVEDLLPGLGSVYK